MRVVTWNVNSVKQRVPRLLPWLDERRPDVLCLQETKLADDAFAALLDKELTDRGYETATLGPRDINGDILGGNRRVVGNAEMLFPMPGYKEKNVRLALFFDFGDVWGVEERMRATDLRYSAGLAVSWDSPVGPLRFSIAQPIAKKPEDKIERFQFQLGKIF